MSTNENKQPVRLIQLNQYIRPKLEENKSKNWVLNGKNNGFYQYVIDRYNGSPTNSAIINSYIDLMIGNGLSAKNQMNTNWIKLKTILSNSDLRRLISDFVIFNECAFQVVKAKNGKDLAGIYHLPIEKVAPSLVNEDNEIETYWFCKDWSKSNTNTPIDFPAFGFDMNEKEHVYKLKPYKAGKEYFADPDYLAGLPYCEMEEEIANYYISHIKNGLSFGYVINIPDGNLLSEEEKDEIERKIKQKLTGSQNAGKFIISFNGKDAEVTITPLQVNDAHKQWEYLTAESRQQILTAHRVTSPMLFGIKDNTGFGNNADELDTAEAQLYKRIIQPKQKMFLEALDDILNAYNINLDLYFRPLTEQSQSVSMSSHVCCSDEKKKTDFKSDLDLFIEMGEGPEIDGYELESVNAVDYDEEDKIEFSTSTGTANSNQKSKFDTEFRLVRYRYAGNPNPEREFCQRMMSAGKIYRREDIDLMGEKNVNPGFGMHPFPNRPYSIWKHKGGGLLSANFTGGTCKHYWEKLTYKKKDIKVDVKSPISIDEAVKDRASGIAGIAPHEI